LEISKTFDVILMVILLMAFVALALYEMVFLLRYRNDPARHGALISSGQVFPKGLVKFLFGEDADTSGRKGSPPNSGRQ
jgi:hypothetical protein